MKINKSFWAIAVGVLALTSCHLDEAPTDSISSSDGEHAITSDLTLEALHNGIYQSFRSTLYGDNSMVEEFMCDGFNAASDYGNNYGPVHRMDATFTSSDYDTEAMWETNYTAIKNYNIFIHSSINFEASSSATETVRLDRAEAYFFRAYSYLQLVRHFGKAYNASSSSTDLAVPLVLKFNLSDKPARATVKEVYEQIKTDLDSAAFLGLADQPGKIASSYLTSDALNMMYARYYLDTKDYAQAASYANSVMTSSAGYAFSADAEAMQQEYVSDNGTEAIIQLAATATENGSGTNSYYTAWTSGENGLYLKPYFIPSQKLLDLYETSDLRYGQWFQTGDYKVLSGTTYYDNVTVFMKYWGNPELRTGNVPNGRQHAKPFLIGEAYLIYVEASYNNGQSANALIALNNLQQQRGASLTAVNEETIENEWFRETVGEGLRMSCLKRWGKGFSGRAAQPLAKANGVVITGTAYDEKVLPANDIHWVWPVPSYEMRVNSNLVQNEGY